jgi:hypothetical protein
MQTSREDRLGSKIHHVETEHDFKKIIDIIKALDFLRTEAHKSGNSEIHTIVTSAFNICFLAHKIALEKKTNDQSIF